ncbi:MAG: hypothetical protein RBU37_08020 [Myxococcota bacterium]|jgi:hypothetical protein|nr:hypothetical protein [Myxococcota bacterium]
MRYRFLPLLTLFVVGTAGCAEMMASHRRYVQSEMERTGAFSVKVDGEVSERGLEGLVMLEGCIVYDMNENADPNAPMYRVMSPENTKRNAANEYTECIEFAKEGLEVQIRAGDFELLSRTDANGRFLVDSGEDLVRLQQAAEEAVLTVRYNGQSARRSVRFAKLGEVAALRSLDEMRDPTPKQIADFLKAFPGTQASELALARFGDSACQSFRDDWNQMMRSGDINKLNLLSERYDSHWQEAFCGYCSAACHALKGASDLSAELGALGR